MPRVIRQLPSRYADTFRQINVESGPPIMTSVGPIKRLRKFWECRLCGMHIRPNAAGAQSHKAMHVRQALRHEESR
jgi:hypothetical protein